MEPLCEPNIICFSGLYLNLVRSFVRSGESLGPGGLLLTVLIGDFGVILTCSMTFCFSSDVLIKLNPTQLNIRGGGPSL